MRNKKILSILLATTLLATMLVGCGNKTTEDNQTTQTGQETTPEASGDVLYSPTLGDVTVTLGDYENIDVSAIEKYEVTDEDIQAQIDSLLSYYANATYLEEGTVEDGTTVYISFNGYIDDVLDENTCSTGYEVTIGSDSMIDGFEDGLIGASVGDVVELNLTFPEDYGHNDYNGKDVRFEVTILNLVEYETSEWNDEFVAANLEYATTAEYEEFLREDMTTYYDDWYKQEISNQIINTLLENSTVENISSEEMDDYIQKGVDYYKSVAESMEMDFESFLTSQIGVATEEEFMEELKAQSESDLNYKYIMLAIAEKESMSLTAQDYTDYLENMASYYGVTQEEIETDLTEGTTKDEVYAAALCNKVIDTLSTKLVESN